MASSISLNKSNVKWPRFILPFFMGLLGICFYNLSVTGFDLQYVPGDSGDARFINYLLEHGYRYMNGSEAHFWNVPFMYPQQNVLAFSDHMIGTAPIYGFFRWLGNDRETAYQLWWITNSLLNFVCCYIVLLKLLHHPIAAVLGAFIFAFGLFNQSQMSYLQMNTRFAVPFIFYYAWQMVHQPRIYHYAMYGIWLCIQFYCVIYTGLLSFYLSLMLMGITILVQRDFTPVKFYLGKKNILWWLLVTVIVVLLLYLLLEPYIAISKITGLRYYKEVVPTLPLLSSYFFAHFSSYPWHFLSHHLQDTPGWFLQNIFPGALPLLAFFTSVVLLVYQRFKKQKPEKTLLVFFLLTTLTFLLFTRTAGNQSLFAVIFKLPGINSMRVLSRVMHVELFLLVFLMGWLIVYFLKQQNKNRVVLIGIVLFLFTMGDNLFAPQASLRTAKKDLHARTERITYKAREVLKQDGMSHIKNLALVSETAENVAFVHLDAMLAAQELNMNCINGYSSYCPTEFGPFFLHAGQKELQHWLTFNQLDPSQILVLDLDAIASH